MMEDKFGKENWVAFYKRYGTVIPEYVAAAESKHLELLDSRKGLPTVRITTAEGKKIFLHSSVDPVQEAEKVVRGLDVLSSSLVVVYGFGLGYLVEALHKNIDERIPIFVIEPDHDLFRAALNTRDLRAVLSSERVFIIAPSDEGYEIATNFFELYDLTRYSNLVITGLSGHQAAYAKAYEKTVHQLSDAVNARLVQEKTMSINGASIMSNSICNLPIYYRSPGIHTLFDQFKGMPAIIVSAGPSLNKNIHLLKKAKGKAVILAVGTALKALQKNGIEPDFMVSIDPNPINYEHFKAVNFPHVPLITEMQTFPKVLENHQGPFFVTGNKPILKWFEGVIEEKGTTESGGSVANNALTVAYKFGADPIILVGQDLAYARDGHSHAAGTNHENIVYNGGEGGNYFLVKANDGGEILTNRAFYQFLKFFEVWIKKYPQPEYINATEGGALIEGTKIMTLQQVLDEYCERSVDVQGIIKEATDSFTVPDVMPFVIRLEQCLANIKTMVKEAYLAIKRLNQLERACENGQAQKMNHYSKDVKRCYEKFEQNTDVRDVVEWFCHDDIQQVLYRTHQAGFKEQDDYHAAVADYKIYYETIIAGAKVAQGLMEDCVIKIRGNVSDGCESL
ncbi:hypothetical protein Ga0466249_000237 [Sporomusaceae bacterium BoRhaA]|uniref:motility associated factor glycosyltransferase family protein n=1 Tax=Pelorhabdus rhamnosifermentans TaxID=2772457 RepID=UPI001C05F8CC|nr:6-hydroxymethylpterin diphosphokinase MptE-like protein [Pelorhabdus rhamnosifermentans]MBU2699158.1 hypothetical protein [Pelorhabdus rhamnosifermentans]